MLLMRFSPWKRESTTVTFSGTGAGVFRPPRLAGSPAVATAASLAPGRRAAAQQGGDKGDAGGESNLHGHGSFIYCRCGAAGGRLTISTSGTLISAISSGAMVSSASAASGVTGGGSIFSSRRPWVISSRSRCDRQRPRRLDDDRRIRAISCAAIAGSRRCLRLKPEPTAGREPRASHSFRLNRRSARPSSRRAWLPALRRKSRRRPASRARVLCGCRPRCLASTAWPASRPESAPDPHRQHDAAAAARPAHTGAGIQRCAGAAPASRTPRRDAGRETRRRRRSTGSVRARRRAPPEAAPGCRAAAGTPRTRRGDAPRPARAPPRRRGRLSPA